MGISTELRAARAGTVIVAACATWFTAFKLCMWNSVVVHEEPGMIERVFFDRVLRRFPQESFNLADFLTTTFLVVAGTLAFLIAFGMSERLRGGTTRQPEDARYVRSFFAIAGVGLVWVGVDEIFLVHEFGSANLGVSNHWFLAAYAAVALSVCVLRWKALLVSKVGLTILVCGALLHGVALGCDFLQKLIGWTPEEPLEMLAAGCYATAMGTYAARLLPAASGDLAATRPTKVQ